MVYWPGGDIVEAEGAGTGAVQKVVTHECPRTGVQIADWDYQKHVARFSTKVTENIYLGNDENANDLKQLKHSKDTITHVLVVARGGKKPFETEGLEYQIVEVDDLPAEPIDKNFRESIDFIEKVVEAKGKVLVHDDTGISRSPTIILAYLIKNGETYKNAVKTLNDCRKKMFQEPVKPNHGFVRQLKNYEKSL
eukprot:UN23681